METSAVLLEKPERLSLEMVGLKDPSQDEVVVQVLHSGISTGTEKLLWSVLCRLFRFGLSFGAWL